MKRRNANSSSSPNSPLDLTSLLDVIFIVLFIVVLAYAKLGDENIESTAHLENTVAAYTEATEQYEQLKDKVDLLSITCTYHYDSNAIERSVTILAGGDENPKYQDKFNSANETQKIERIRVFLQDYIQDNKEKTIFIEINNEMILEKDLQELEGIVHELKEAFPDVIRR